MAWDLTVDVLEIEPMLPILTPWSREVGQVTDQGPTSRSWREMARPVEKFEGGRNGDKSKGQKYQNVNGNHDEMRLVPQHMEVLRGEEATGEGDENRTETFARVDC